MVHELKSDAEDDSTTCHPGVQALQPYAPGKPLSELEREYGIHNAVKLASNENPLGPSPRVLDALRAQFGDLARYPDGNGFELKAVLAGKHGVPMESVTLGNGSNDVLELVARAFLSPDSAAVFSAHAFAVYPIVTQAIGARCNVAAAHNGSRGPNYGHDLDAMAASIDAQTRVVFIANPNNPTGTWLGDDELRSFVEQVSGDVIVVIDEAYFEYVSEAGYPNAMEWIARFPEPAGDAYFFQGLWSGVLAGRLWCLPARTCGCPEPCSSAFQCQQFCASRCCGCTG